MSDDNLSYDELRERLARSEAALESLRRGDVDILVGPTGPLTLRLKSLVEENERLAREWQTTFDSTRDAIWILDQNQRVIRSNKTAETYFHRPCEEFVGKHCWEIVHGTAQPIPECPILRARKSLCRETMELKIGEGWFLVTVDPILDASGKFAGAVHIVSDITERKQAAETLRDSEEKFRAIASNTPDHIIIQGRDLRYSLVVNPQLGLTEADMVGKTDREIMGIGNEDAENLTAIKRKVLETGEPFHAELPLKNLKGETEYFDGSYIPKRDMTGKIDGLIGYFRNVTDRRRAEEALCEREESLRLYFTTVNDIIFSLDINGALLSISPSIEKILGYKPEELIGKPFMESGILAPEYLDHAISDSLKVFAGETITAVEYEFLAKNGDKRIGEVNSSPIFKDGKVVATASVARDITERKRGEQELQESKQLLESVVENIPLMIFLKEADDLRFVVFNKAGEELLGYDRKDLLGKNNLDLFPPEQAAWFMAKDREVLAAGEMLDIPEEPIQTAKKGQRLLHTRKICIKGSDGATKYLLGISEDITERKLAETKIRQLSSTVEAATVSVGISALDGTFTYVNNTLCDTFGYERDELIGQSVTMLDVDESLAPVIFESLMRDRKWSGEVLQRRKDGTIFPALLSLFMALDEKKELQSVVAFVNDITERKRADEEKEKLQAQLQQAQKMESVGRLAGGVAHDFNNLLQGILGFSEIMQSKIDPNDPLSHYVTEIIKASESAVGLTKQLLAFSRKQIISPKVIDLNGVVAHSKKMLSRLIGEDIDLVFVPADGLWNTKVDPSQIDQILINLAVNSRDAMPDGGKLTIETANATFDEEYCGTHQGVVPGEFVMLAMSDTGSGMGKEVQDKIFEPFFTTKEKGKGTGLGLSMVYGIVKQHGGFIFVYSEPGEGTTFKLYLPRVEAKLDPAEVLTVQKSLTGTETVLLVEDQEMVRRLAKDILKHNGYRVLEAANGGEAYLKFEKYEDDIHLLLTDVVMPNMNGQELYERLVRMKPGLKVVYMSGYTDNAIAHRGVLDPGMFFIPKPFKAVELLQKVREALNAPPPVLETTKAGTVLLIDDEENIRVAVRLFLEDEKLEVLTAENGEEGVRLFRERVGEIDLVLLDQTLPDSTGMEVFGKLRDLRGDVPIVIVSGYGSNDLTQILQDNERIGFLPKPFRRAELLAAVKKALPKRS